MTAYPMVFACIPLNGSAVIDIDNGRGKAGNLLSWLRRRQQLGRAVQITQRLR